VEGRREGNTASATLKRELRYLFCDSGTARRPGLSSDHWRNLQWGLIITDLWFV